MIPNVYLNNMSMLSLGWCRESVDFPTPRVQKQDEFQTVPGRNTPIRFTQALGDLSYEVRTFTIVLSMLGTRSAFMNQSNALLNEYAGKLTNVILSEDPDMYAVGTLDIQPSYDPLTGKGTVTISCTDGDSYLYHVDKTSKSFAGAGTVSLSNDYMPTVPEITVTAETKLSWELDNDGIVSKVLSAGTWIIPELELHHGDTSITIAGTGSGTFSGKTTFTYQEGHL